MRRLPCIIRVGHKCTHKSPYKREVEGNLTSEEKMIWQKQKEIWSRYIAGFEDEGYGHERRNTRSATLEAGKGKEIDSPLQPLEGEQPYKHLDFIPVKLI